MVVKKELVPNDSTTTHSRVCGTDFSGSGSDNRMNHRSESLPVSGERTWLGSADIGESLKMRKPLIQLFECFVSAGAPVDVKLRD
jgi:hypothetical protein